MSPFNVFFQAEIFHQSAKAIKHSFDQAALSNHWFNGVPRNSRKYGWIPWGVNGAFATELYLKCIHSLASGISPRGHNLKKLFYALPVARRKRLCEIYHGLCKNKLDTDIKSGCKVFEDWRYGYERANMPEIYRSGWSGELPEAARNMIFEIMPDWKMKLTTN